MFKKKQPERPKAGRFIEDKPLGEFITEVTQKMGDGEEGEPIKLTLLVLEGNKQPAIRCENNERSWTIDWKTLVSAALADGLVDLPPSSIPATSGPEERRDGS